MKKLLYTLFAFAIIIACEKDMDDNYNVDSISPIEAQVDIDFDALKNQLEGLMGATSKIGTPRSTTQRGGDNGDNWIELTAFNGTGADSNAIFAHVFTEGNPILCYDGFTLNGAPVVTSTYSFDDDGRSAVIGILTIEVDGAVQTFDIPEPLRSTYVTNFGNSFDGVFRVATTSNGGYSVSGSQPNRADFTFPACASAGPAPITWTAPSAANGIGTYTSSTGLTYIISAAPFPLTGFLATTSESGSANYAGTTIQAVRDAIELDLTD